MKVLYLLCTISLFSMKIFASRICTCDKNEYIVKNCTSSDDAVCEPCSTCNYAEQLEIQKCTATSNTICACPSHTFPNHNLLICEECSRCKLGMGVTEKCSTRNTKCENCRKGTFSNRKSASQPCSKCKSCQDNYYVYQNCTSFSDTVCMPMIVQQHNTESTTTSTPSKVPTTEPTPAVIKKTSSPVVINKTSNYTKETILIISLCAVVCIIVLVLIVCKYRSKKKNMFSEPVRGRTRGNTNDSTSTNETFVDENNIHISKVPCSFIDEIAMLLNGGGWKRLAGRLEYTMTEISNMEVNTDSPTHRLVQTWQCNENATVYKLYKELMSMSYEVAANKLLPLLIPQEIV